MRRIIAMIALAAALSGCGNRGRHADGDYVIELFTTSDVHGRYFDSLYVGDATRESLLAVSEYMNGVRSRLGRGSYLFIDAGDCIQGDNASYWFNYVDTVSRHIYPRLAEYMGYDAVCVGNHDIETGHAVYDRVASQMTVPFLAANALREGTSKPYFKDYVMLERQGFKVAVIGFTNPGIKGWLSPEIWEGIRFESLIPLVQEKVDMVMAKEHPDIVIAATHSGTGSGDGSSLESQGLDLLHSLNGVDFIICAHDHKPLTAKEGETCLIDSGSHCRNIGHGTVSITVRDGKIVSKTTDCELIPVDRTKTDEAMRKAFRDDYEAVREFSMQPVGELGMTLYTCESLKGPCDYMNLIHAICLGCPPAQLSFAAPLAPDGIIREGKVIYNDLFTIYPYENQLLVIRMSGQQIKGFLEYSYDRWINAFSGDGPVYNLDSMAGAFYTVDVTRPMGERVKITALADGTPFDLEESYNVAMTSYRASGGGKTMSEGAGIDTEKIDEITVARYPEIRELVHRFFRSHVDDRGDMIPVTSDELSRRGTMGYWSFVQGNAGVSRSEKDR